MKVRAREPSPEPQSRRRADALLKAAEPVQSHGNPSEASLGSGIIEIIELTVQVRRESPGSAYSRPRYAA